MRMALEPGARYLAAEGLDNIDEAATSMAATLAILLFAPMMVSA